MHLHLEFYLSQNVKNLQIFLQWNSIQIWSFLSVLLNLLPCSPVFNLAFSLLCRLYKPATMTQLLCWGPVRIRDEPKAVDLKSKWFELTWSTEWFCSQDIILSCLSWTLLQLLAKLNIQITEAETEELIRAIDLDGDGEIDFEGTSHHRCKKTMQHSTNPASTCLTSSRSSFFLLETKCGCGRFSSDSAKFNPPSFAKNK